MARVTVLTATYNRAHLLAETIRSVLGQTFTDLEYIIVDDGSTDSTARVVQSLAEQDSRIHYVVQPHAGLAATWETLFALAKGEYVAWLSDDDLWDETFLERTIHALDENPDATVAYADYLNLIDENLVPAPEPRRCSLSIEHLLYGCFISMCLALIRRSALKQVRTYLGSYFDPIGGSACGDWVLFLNLWPLGRFVHICEPLGTLRLHAEQDSVTTSVLELARRRFAVRRKYAKIPFSMALREAAELVAWGTYNRLRKRLREK